MRRHQTQEKNLCIRSVQPALEPLAMSSYVKMTQHQLEAEPAFRHLISTCWPWSVVCASSEAGVEAGYSSTDPEHSEAV